MSCLSRFSLTCVLFDIWVLNMCVVWVVLFEFNMCVVGSFIAVSVFVQNLRWKSLYNFLISERKRFLQHFKLILLKWSYVSLYYTFLLRRNRTVFRTERDYSMTILYLIALITPYVTIEVWSSPQIVAIKTMGEKNR